MSRGPARPINFSEDRPRPGRAPSQFQFFTARPGPAHQFSESLGPAVPGPSHFQKARPGPSQFSDRPGPARLRPTANDKPCLFLLRRPHWTALFAISYQVRGSSLCAVNRFQYMHTSTHVPCGHWLDLGSFYFTSEGARLVHLSIRTCG